MESGRCLHEIVEARAAEFPERIAVTSAGRGLTYRELDARADAVAVALRARGVGPDVVVGLCARRSPELVVAMLGVLKAGGAYLPVDPDYPRERIWLLLADSGTALVLADDAGAARVGDDGPQVLSLAALLAPENAGPRPAPAEPAAAVAGTAGTRGTVGTAGTLGTVRDDHLAYVIYTSGSTGRPKGVEVEHRAVVRLFTATAGWFGFDEHDTWVLFHSPSFDFSVWEIWGALLHGGRLVVIPPDAARAPSDLVRLLRTEGVTVLNQTPSAFRVLLAADAALPAAERMPLRTVVFGGERLDVGMLQPWIARYGTHRPRLVNMYGITETTVHVTYRPLAEADLDDPGSSPIGVPIPDLEVSLRDLEGQVVPDDTPGELWVVGPGVARGYRGRPDLTAERFVTLPDGRRGYRSGDLAVRRPVPGLTGATELVYLGRADDQIKVRGFRIEPFEVETCLLSHPGVVAAVVDGVDLGDGDVRLVAFVQFAAGTGAGARDVDAARVLRAHVADRLPVHLRPSEYRFVTVVPLTPAGKADRAALRRGLGATPVGAAV
ncbi:MAG TPA: amino acid adenylation domain-containing protein [Kineosporiaceae bacterium]